MTVFGEIIRTAVDIVTTLVAIAKDIATLGGSMTGKRTTYTGDHLQKLKDEADD